ncbi:methyl-accepting chemotaxis protein [Anaeroselena agilis]|uniref:Methyl-accepting chemotaxis protein n=1 Tax=Anaeroselena agilis TaxID=3063788 RepID=A0ABU3NSC1_9FIRM|nr:methyl-accepting chemotaxis protein [Selenomonadales bacterium 4137-cl]
MLNATKKAGNLAVSIKAKLVITVCVVLAVSIGFVAFFNLRGSNEALTKKTAENMLANAEAAAEGIGKEVAAMKAVVEVISADDRLRSGDAKVVVARLAEIRKAMPQIENLLLVEPGGAYIDAGGKTGSVASREYYKEILQTKKTVVSGDPVISQFSGKLVAVVITPVKGGQGYLAAGMQIDGITDYVLHRKIGDKGYTYAFGKSGIIFIHPDKKVAMKLNLLGGEASPDLAAMAKTAIGGEKSVREYEFDGTMRYAGCAPVPGTSWGVGTALLRTEALAVTKEMERQALLIAMIAMVLSGLIIYFIATKLINPVIRLVGAADRMADGDLTQNVSVAANDEVGRLSAAFNAMGANLRDLVRQIQKNAEQVAAASEELTATSDQSALAANQIAESIAGVAASAGQQSAAADDTAAVVEEMSASIQAVAVNAHQVAAQSAQAADKAKSGDLAVAKAVAQMDEIEETVNNSAGVVTQLGERSKEIGQIVDTIAGIAGQTNLLALNAAIEAARAGEQGRGFAVVAEEVRKLAEQSQEAAKQIAVLIGEIRNETDRAVTAMNDGTREVKSGAEAVKTAGAAFREIADLVSVVSEQVREISAAIQQMAAGSQQIVGSVKRMDELGKQSAGEAQGVSAAAEEQLAAMEEIASSSQSLAKLAQDLQSAVARFRI